jgi:hypothetical protein
MSFSGVSAYNPRTGIVDFGTLPPGVYTVRVTASQGQGNPNAPANSMASATVIVSNTDIHLGVLRLEPPNVVSGKILADGPLPTSSSGSLVEVNLQAPESLDVRDPINGTRARPQPDGSFTASFPYALLRITESFTGYYIREARLDGADAFANFARVSRSSNLEIVLSSKVAQLQGIVRDEKAQPAAGVRVVLVPDTMRDQVQLFKDAVSDQNGRFSIPGIRPGDYKVFAWEGLERFAYFDPEVLRRYAPKGKAIHLSESSNETVDLQMIAAGVD